MLTVEIPGRFTLNLAYLVLDYNGTIAVDGKLLPGVGELLVELNKFLKIYVLTRDTFGKVREELALFPFVELIIVGEPGAQEKRKFLEKLGAEKTVAIGNGYNDRLMLKEAALGILVIEEEGASIEALLSADIIVKSPIDALKLLTNKGRMVATLRC
ncbi:HAD family hydrolase [Carboxydothermus pertinax]|uniref:ATPase P n=1 Tax=Carboxydothermus pertinax TaxID=870242 RepID=A0A1L8CT86_9THEO|nr:HAD family hydrolase [Carboxydothermus pertinax]GAV22131.1 ATPase P [Carboxydothermus pertinax]